MHTFSGVHRSMAVCVNPTVCVHSQAYTGPWHGLLTNCETSKSGFAACLHQPSAGLSLGVCSDYQRITYRMKYSSFALDNNPYHCFYHLRHTGSLCDDNCCTYQTGFVIFVYNGLLWRINPTCIFYTLWIEFANHCKAHTRD